MSQKIIDAVINATSDDARKQIAEYLEQRYNMFEDQPAINFVNEVSKSAIIEGVFRLLLKNSAYFSACDTAREFKEVMKNILAFLAIPDISKEYEKHFTNTYTTRHESLMLSDLIEFFSDIQDCELSEAEMDIVRIAEEQSPTDREVAKIYANYKYKIIERESEMQISEKRGACFYTLNKHFDQQESKEAAE